MSRFKLRKPSPSLAISIVALVFAMGGSAVAATKLLIHTRNIANGAVTTAKLRNGAVTASKLDKALQRSLASAGSARGVVAGVQGAAGADGRDGASGTNGLNGLNGQNGRDGSNGANGTSGTNGANGTNGLNPAVAVVNVPSIASSSGKNPNPDSGDPGDGGWYFSGNSSDASNCPDVNCTASLSNGELIVTGAGDDSNTTQGGVGIAKAFDSMPLTNLTALSYQWHINVANGDQAPTIHVTVTGAYKDSVKASGYTNLTYSPGVKGGSFQPGVLYQADTMDTALWYSTREPGVTSTYSPPGSQGDPQPFSFFVHNDPSAVIGQISLDNGGSSGGVHGTFDAGADGLLLGIDGTNTRYDFGG